VSLSSPQVFIRQTAPSAPLMLMSLGPANIPHRHVSCLFHEPGRVQREEKGEHAKKPLPSLEAVAPERAVCVVCARLPNRV